MVACLYRGSFGAYPKRFRRKMLDLHPAALIFRPFWSSPSRFRFRIPRGDIISATLGRPDRTTIFYSPGSRLFDYAAFDVIACQMADGKLDLAVPRPDVRLVLHYLNSPPAASSDGSN